MCILCWKRNCKGVENSAFALGYAAFVACRRKNRTAVFEPKVIDRSSAVTQAWCTKKLERSLGYAAFVAEWRKNL